LDLWCKRCGYPSQGAPGIVSESIIAERLARWKCNIGLQDIKKETAREERKEERRKRWEDFMMAKLLKDEIDEVPQEERVIIYDPKSDWSNFFSLVNEEMFNSRFPGEIPNCWLCFDGDEDYWTVRQLPCGCLFHPGCFDSHIQGTDKSKCSCPTETCHKIYNLVPVPSFEDELYPA
jgi:hypothetical protein